MNLTGIVKVHIMLHPEAELRQADVIFNFDVLIFQCLPETLHFGIIQTASTPVHVIRIP